MTTDKLTLCPLPNGAIATHIRFATIRGYETVDIPVADAAKFFIENYATHTASRFKWNTSTDFTTFVIMKWRVDYERKVTEVFFNDCAGSRWVSVAISTPRFLGVRA